MATTLVQLYTTGPAHVFVGRAETGPLYLGTATEHPTIEVKPEFAPVFNDIGGKKPIDMSYQGEDGLSLIEFSRWSETVYALLAARPRSLGAPGNLPRGLNGPADVGSLILTEGLNFTVWIMFPFAIGKAAYSNLPHGYRFPGSYLLGPDRHQKMGTTPKDLYLVFHHLRLFDGPSGALFLYDHDMSAVVNVPLT